MVVRDTSPSHGARTLKLSDARGCGTLRRDGRIAMTLLERDGVLATAQALLDSALADEGSALLIEAAAGMGKTSVLDEVRTQARGMRVLGARGVEQERGFPLGVVRQLLTSALRNASVVQQERW